MSAPRIQKLDWDSGHYGMQVGTIAQPVDTPDMLHTALVAAKALGLQLVYWLSTDTFIPDRQILDRFGGRRIVGYHRYRRLLTAPDRDRMADPRCASVTGTRAEKSVLDLALLAGQCSRFRLDTRLPAHGFEVMYERWITKSLSRELADDVLVLRDLDGQMRSLLTYQLRDTTAVIGLVATSLTARGQGFGSAMLAEAHRRISRVGADNVIVSTQSENRTACRFYEASGYAVVFQGSHYHFLMR
jgi:dTDP-4-amino-4,6-dideoxy-D-galactose acyltransferase